MRLFFSSSTHVILALIPTLGSKHSHKVLFPAIAGDNPHVDFHGYAGLRVPFRRPVYVSTHLHIRTHTYSPTPINGMHAWTSKCSRVLSALSLHKSRHSEVGFSQQLETSTAVICCDRVFPLHNQITL